MGGGGGGDVGGWGGGGGVGESTGVLVVGGWGNFSLFIIPKQVDRDNKSYDLIQRACRIWTTM